MVDGGAAGAASSFVDFGAPSRQGSDRGYDEDWASGFGGEAIPAQQRFTGGGGASENVERLFGAMNRFVDPASRTVSCLWLHTVKSFSADRGIRGR